MLRRSVSTLAQRGCAALRAAPSCQFAPSALRHFSGEELRAPLPSAAGASRGA